MPAPASTRELLLTLSPEQEREFTDDVAALREKLGTQNVTQTVLAALRQARLDRERDEKEAA